MKTYTPNDSTAMADAVHATFGRQAMFIEGRVFHCAGANSDEYKGGTWAFATNDKGDLGFWYPLGQDTYPVACQNYYDNPAMDAKSFGAACTLIAVNQHAWRMHEAGERVIAQRASDLFHALRHWIFDLGEGANPFLDSGAVAGFID